MKKITRNTIKAFIRYARQDLHIRNLDYKYLSKLDVGGWFDKKFSDQKIPTFENILKKYIHKVHLQIELKSNEKDLADIVINNLKKLNWYNFAGKPYKVPGYSITSFDFNNLVNVRKLSKSVRVGWLLSIDREDIKTIKKMLVDFDINMIIPKGIKIAPASHILAVGGIDTIIFASPPKAAKPITPKLTIPAFPH